MTYADLFNDLAEATQPSRGTRRFSAPGLSEEQEAALNASLRKSATIKAGAGAGKTRLIVERAAALLLSGVDPARLAIVTFTRKAAAEIQHRIATRLGAKQRQLPVCSTVHALALSMLLKQNFAVNVSFNEDQTILIKTLREELPDELASFSDTELIQELNRRREQEAFTGMLGMVTLRYEELLDENGVQDFTTLLRMATQNVRGEFTHILVDEAQDISRLQKAFLRVCGKPDCRYWFIGDPDQAIYAFRGAHDNVMSEFQAETDEQYILSVNYRSARAIVAHANNVIQNNKGRDPIQWKAHRTEEGSVMVEDFANADEELDTVIQWVSQKQGRMVLGRTQALLAPLKALGLPAMTVHESKGLEWPEVWIMGCEAALFPHPLSARDEERRLFYVAMTRARDSLTMSYCKTRSAKKQASTRAPSCFLFETQGLAT